MRCDHLRRTQLMRAVAAVMLCIQTQENAVLAGDTSPIQSATSVISYAAGTGAGISYQNPNSALGPPTLATGTGVDPGAVTPFQPAFMPADVVSIGRGGHLVLAFAQPVYDDPRHAHGIDLIVYGNPLLTDLGYPGGVAGLVFAEGGTIEVSADGQAWHSVPGQADGGLPTLAYLDSGPYDAVAGRVPADPSKPVDPAIDPDALLGLDYPSLVAVYEGGAGGTGVDLAEAGLTAARYVRFTVAPSAASVPEVDAVVAVRCNAAPADLNGDGAVNGADLGMLLAAWGQATFADLDGNGVVGGSDLGLLLGAWGP